MKHKTVIADLAAYPLSDLEVMCRYYNAPTLEKLAKKILENNKRANMFGGAPIPQDEPRPISTDRVLELANGDVDVALRTAIQGRLGVEVVRNLIDAGADVDKNINGSTNMKVALVMNQPEIVNLLLERGAARSPLHRLELLQESIFEDGDIETFKRRLRNFDPNYNPKRDLPLLTIAANVGDLDKARALIEAGADVNIASDVASPLAYAAKGGNVDIIRLLLDSGAKIVSDHYRKGSALQYSTTGAAARELISAGADVNHADLGGWTPIIGIAWGGDEEPEIDTLIEVIEAGADINHTDNNGNTALIYAARHNYPDMVRVLLDKGAIVDNETMRKTRDVDQNIRQMLERARAEKFGKIKSVRGKKR